VEPDGDWPAVRAATRQRMKALRIGTARLARVTGLSETTIRYFGLKPAAPSTLTQVNNALGFPAGHLLAVLRGESPEPAAVRDTVGKCLIRIERKLDQLLTLYSQAQDATRADWRTASDAPPDADHRGF
jgi:hypothetical protein